METPKSILYHALEGNLKTITIKRTIYEAKTV